MSSSGDSDGRPSAFSGRTAWARNLETPLREFLRTETGGAAVLLAAAFAALVRAAVERKERREDEGGQAGWLTTRLAAFAPPVFVPAPRGSSASAH
jgi:hypothetical protein